MRIKLIKVSINYKRLITIISLLIFTFYNVEAYTQNWSYYSQLSERAYALYKQKNFSGATVLYSKLRNTKFQFTQYKLLQHKQNIYLSSVSWTKCNKFDSAFSNLNYLISSLGYDDLGKIKSDTNFNRLQNHNEWKVILNKVESNFTQRQSKRNIKLINLLDSILQDDQRYRTILSKMEMDSVRDTIIMKDLIYKMKFNDSLNLSKIEGILNLYGWPSPDMIDDRGEVIFLVLQHSPLTCQEKYLPLLMKSVKRNEADAQYFAYLVDRINISKGKKQVYGTQVGFNPKSGKPFVEPILDPFKVDKMRMDVDLPPLKEYLGMFNVDWDPLLHLKQQNGKPSQRKK